ncbi:DHHC zinc finger domain protein, partial [Opisthorchis viverrini]
MMYNSPEVTSATICEVRHAVPTPYYRVHMGKNRFCCRGRGVHSREMSVFYLSLFLIIVVTALFFAFEVRMLTPVLSPALPLFAVVLFLYVLLTFLRTAFTDPGIIPRATEAEAEWIKISIATGDFQVDGTGNFPLNDSANSVVRSYAPGARTRQVLIRDHLMRLNFCHSCRFFRPPRASHCSTCDNCVGRWFTVDMTNVCIVFASFTCQYSIAYVYNGLAQDGLIGLIITVLGSETVLGAETTASLSCLSTPYPCILSTYLCLLSSILYCILVTFFTILTVFGLSGYHTMLVCRELSTHEDIRHFPRILRQAGHRNPFSRKNGCLNFVYILFGPLQPSLLRGWKIADEQSWPVGARGSLTGPSSMNELLFRPSITNYVVDLDQPLSIPVNIEQIPPRRVVLDFRVEERHVNLQTNELITSEWLLKPVLISSRKSCELYDVPTE